MRAFAAAPGFTPPRGLAEALFFFRPVATSFFRPVAAVPAELAAATDRPWALPDPSDGPERRGIDRGSVSSGSAAGYGRCVRCGSGSAAGAGRADRRRTPGTRMGSVLSGGYNGLTYSLVSSLVSARAAGSPADRIVRCADGGIGSSGLSPS